MTDKDITEIKSMFYKQQAAIESLGEKLNAAVELIINRAKDPVILTADRQWLTPEEVCELTHCKYHFIKLKKKEWGLIWRKSGKTYSFRADKVYEFMKTHNINAL